MQSDDGITQTLFWENLNSVMSENEVSKVNFNNFMADNLQANWNAVIKINIIGDPSLPLVRGDLSFSLVTKFG